MMCYLCISQSVAAGALHEIKHKVHNQDANKVQGEAECFISIEATCLVHYFA